MPETRPERGDLRPLQVNRHEPARVRAAWIAAEERRDDAGVAQRFGTDRGRIGWQVEQRVAELD